MQKKTKKKDFHIKILHVLMDSNVKERECERLRSQTDISVSLLPIPLKEYSVHLLIPEIVVHTQTPIKHGCFSSILCSAFHHILHL